MCLTQITPPQLSVITLKVIINLIEIVVVVVVGLYLINHIMQDINVPVSNSKISQHSAKQNTVSSFATVSKVFVGLEITIGIKRFAILPFTPLGWGCRGAHWALEPWYVTLRPK